MLAMLAATVAPSGEAADPLATAPGSSGPNVVVILTDDQGWGDLSLHGNHNLRTPRLDALAESGAEFEHFFVSPVCAPTRAEFLTGRYHPRCGVRGVTQGAERMNLDEVTIADRFRAAGYATAAVGKWHNGMQYPYHPCGRGFESFYGFCSGHWGDYFSPPLEHNGQPVRGNGYLTDDFTNHAIQFVHEHAAEPFFLYVAYNTPHSPMQVPDKWYYPLAKSKLPQRHRDPKLEDEAHTRAALAMCENIDWNVGRLLDQLDALNLAEQTIVLFFCDNGPNGYRFNGGMKGHKGSTDEGGVRSPLFIRWPGRIPPGTRIEPITAAIDLAPTLIELAGLETPASGERPAGATAAAHVPFDGQSLVPLLQDPAANWPQRKLFSHWGGRVSVRTDKYRLDHEGQLFDMQRDPGQRRNVAQAHPQIAADLMSAVAQWKGTMLPLIATDDRPLTLGSAQFAFTELPARDATARGSIRRSNRHANCSYFTHWTSLDDSIQWDVDVRLAGTYLVDLQYACRDEDVPVVLRISCGEQSLDARIDASHDPPLRGHENDRVKRVESYVKDFATHSLGTLRLPAGRRPVVLQAVEMTGGRAVEVRGLRWTRVGN
jgi:arylsulfatase A-like enzyme